jgi:hypothetical protein
MRWRAVGKLIEASRRECIGVLVAAGRFGSWAALRVCFARPSAAKGSGVVVESQLNRRISGTLRVRRMMRRPQRPYPGRHRATRYRGRHRGDRRPTLPSVVARRAPTPQSCSCRPSTCEDRTCSCRPMPLDGRIWSQALAPRRTTPPTPPSSVRTTEPQKGHQAGTYGSAPSSSRMARLKKDPVWTQQRLPRLGFT